MFKIYSAYIASNFILPFLVSTVFFVSFLMTFEIFRIMTLVSSNEIGFFFIVRLMGNVLVTLIPMAVPISIFFSTIFCLSRMSSDSEYVALRAAGLDKLKILRPFMMIALVISICVFFLTQELVPNAHRKVRRKIKIVSSASLVEGLKTGQFFTTIPNVTLFPTKVDEITKEMKDVFLHQVEPDNGKEMTIVAKSGKILHKKDEKTGIESLKLYLQNGNIANKLGGVESVEKIKFGEYTIPISEKRFSYRTSLKEIMMNYQELSAFINNGFEAAKKRGFNKKEYFNAKYEYWNRINTPFLCLILTFLGFCLGITGNRGHSKNSSGKAILYLIGYYAVYFTIVSVARDGSVPISVAMVLPLSLLLAVAVKHYRNVDWQS